MTLTANRINYTSTPVNNLLHNIESEFIRVLYLKLFTGIECEVKLTRAINVIYYLLTLLWMLANRYH
jgi:Na+/pantothenate symporter